MRFLLLIDMILSDFVSEKDHLAGQCHRRSQRNFTLKWRNKLKRCSAKVSSAETFFLTVLDRFPAEIGAARLLLEVAKDRKSWDFDFMEKENTNTGAQHCTV